MSTERKLTVISGASPGIELVVATGVPRDNGPSTAVARDEWPAGSGKSGRCSWDVAWVRHSSFGV